VITQSATSRDVYLPRGTDWYDFWTGRRFSGGQVIHRAAPLNVLPLYVRAGSILPMGPEEEYAGEYPNAPVELRIYPGRDGDTSLYFDDGLTYAYQNGQFARIPLHWDNAARRLSIGARQGQFAISAQRFDVILVGPGRGVGEPITRGNRRLSYNGNALQARF
jgi:alpha-D-xyloside xylohydrolase